MVIRILTGKEVAGAVAYNEKKVADKQAERLLVANYPDAELAQQNDRFRLHVLQQYARLNPAIVRPSIHLAVAFHSSETLSPGQLQTIGVEVMQGAGYGKQPYLLYQHHDTAHPHIHLVSVSIDARGNRVNDTFLKKRLQQLRRKLEMKHGLRPAEKLTKLQQTGRVGEGLVVCVSLLTRISRALLDYTFGSLNSFGQFLQTQRIQMNRQAGHSRSGITFQAVDEKGTLSRAIKASAVPGWPTRLNSPPFFTGTAQHQQKCEHLSTVLRQQSGKFLRLTETDYIQTMRDVGIEVSMHGTEYLYVHLRSGTVAQEQELDAAFSRRVLYEQFSDRTQRRAVSTHHREVVQPTMHTEQLTGISAILETHDNTDQPQPLPPVKTIIQRQQPPFSIAVEEPDVKSELTENAATAVAEQRTPTTASGTDRLRKKVRKNNVRRIS